MIDYRTQLDKVTCPACDGLVIPDESTGPWLGFDYGGICIKCGGVVAYRGGEIVACVIPRPTFPVLPD
jgi:hypothetical protein